jgi:hypothetical protein
MPARSDKERSDHLLALAQADAEERWRHYSQVAGMQRTVPHEEAPVEREEQIRVLPLRRRQRPVRHLLAPGFTGANKRQRTFAEVGLKVDVSAFKGDTSPSGASSRSAEQSGCHRNPLRSTAESDARACGPSDSHFQFQNDEVTRRSSG